MITIKNNFEKILIANRGEIALRIQQTCKSLGIQTVAIYAPQDNSSPHVYQADQAYFINHDGYKAYLAQDEIIEIAKKSDCDAIHPGYGFLSENATFAQKVVDAGITWIGPNPQTIRLMGDKNQARIVAQEAGVPTVPGAKLENIGQISTNQTNFQNALDLAKQVGFPLILKDPLGGGGKGARRVNSEAEFENALNMTISESQKLTGTTTILLERYLENARHVEIQIAGDGQNFVHLFERDCSLQRRYQKIIEESPCLFVSKATLETMYNAAISLAKAVNYQNVGTIEFMVADQDFYFLEMNTRLQVEHSVTEMTTGVDLVALQLQIAQTGQLTIKQEDITQHGHAIECRIYSEDPENNFAPCAGKINYLEIPQMPFIRVDHALQSGCEVSPFFDPMQAKVTVFGQNRELATAYMQTALKNFHINGITTNTEFLLALLYTEEFGHGNFHTQTLTQAFIEQVYKKYKNKECQDLTNQELISQELTSQEIGAIAATILHCLKKQNSAYTPSKTYEIKKAQKPDSKKDILWKAQQWQ
ncbi:MAG: biotin carboxylase N-terminal domain-containing protein [Candidatus Babeliales bacterium]|jgi:acetyl-CoA carboxylase biotin carboxylase subunit|nr:MAG: pyruvate carboxylase subunit A [candidate division TM6 bacterium GW2011_GWF2_36_6]